MRIKVKNLRTGRIGYATKREAEFFYRFGLFEIVEDSKKDTYKTKDLQAESKNVAVQKASKPKKPENPKPTK